MKYMKNTLIFSIIMLVIGTCLLITGFIIEQNGSEANPMFFWFRVWTWCSWIS